MASVKQSAKVRKNSTVKISNNFPNKRIAINLYRGSKIINKDPTLKLVNVSPRKK